MEIFHVRNHLLTVNLVFFIVNEIDAKINRRTQMNKSVQSRNHISQLMTYSVLALQRTDIQQIFESLSLSLSLRPATCKMNKMNTNSNIISFHTVPCLTEALTVLVLYKVHPRVALIHSYKSHTHTHTHTHTQQLISCIARTGDFFG